MISPPQHPRANSSAADSPALDGAAAQLRWPTRHSHFVDAKAPAASRAVLITVVLAAVLADVMVHNSVSSLSGLATVSMFAALVLQAPNRRTAGGLASVALVILVASNLVLRTSDWVVVPSVVAINVLLVLGAQDRFTSLTLRRFAGSVRGLWLAHLEAVPMLGRLLGRWFDSSNGRRAAHLRGLLVALVVAIVVSVALANGDPVFAALFDDLDSPVAWEHLIVIGCFIIPAASVAAMTHLVAEIDDELERDRAGLLRPLEALMGLGAMIAVLALWAATQLTVRLGGADRLLAREGLTPAGYARRGFFELVVAVIVVTIVLAVLTRAAIVTHRRTTVRLVAVTAAETLLLVGVTYSKLAFYMGAFGLTMLRLAVAFFLAWLAVAVVLLAIRFIGPWRQPWLVTGLLGSAALTVAIFGWINPEARVVEANVALAESGAAFDEDYLEKLGSDAEPTIVELLPETATSDRICARVADDGSPGLWNWNLGRARAAAVRC